MPYRLPRRGQLEFVRFVRSDRVLKLLARSKLTVPEDLVHRYVTATLHVRTERLVIVCDGWRHELTFHISP